LSEYFFLSFFDTKGLNNPHPRGSKETEWVSRQLIRLAHFTCKINGEPSAAEINGSANNKSPFSASFSGPDRAQSAALWTRTRTCTRSRNPGFPEPGEPPVSTSLSLLMRKLSVAEWPSPLVGHPYPHPQPHRLLHPYSSESESESGSGVAFTTDQDFV